MKPMSKEDWKMGYSADAPRCGSGCLLAVLALVGAPFVFALAVLAC